MREERAGRSSRSGAFEPLPFFFSTPSSEEKLGVEECTYLHSFELAPSSYGTPLPPFDLGGEGGVAGRTRSYHCIRRRNSWQI